MTTSRNRNQRVFLELILCSFLAAHLCFRLRPNVFEMANAQAIDQLYTLRGALPKFWPDCDPAVVGTAFVYGSLIFHLGRPVLMLVFAMVSILIYQHINEDKEKMEGLRQRDFIRDTFGRYLSSAVVEELPGSPQGLKMSGEIREVTFLVSDLRGFTALTASLAPP